ncbi:hypothetical protein [Candidatus Methylomirabilis sp.]|jgi:hypothetical protein
MRVSRADSIYKVSRLETAVSDPASWYGINHGHLLDEMDGLGCGK